MATAAPGERDSSLFGTLRALLGSVVALLHSRAELLSLELGEERERIRGLVVPAMLALLFLFVGLQLLPLLLVVVFWDSYRIPALAIVTGAYLLIGVASLVVLRRRWALRTKPFAATIEELKKDMEALGVRDE